MIANFFRGLAAQFLRALPGAAEEVYQKASIKGIREVICYNQGKIADYDFVASEKHKHLKTELLRLKSPGTRTTQDYTELEARKNNLSSYLDQEFRRISEENFKYLLNFYKYKSPGGKQPRVCIKAIQGNNTITLARDRFSNALEEDFRVTENTAFISINETGKYYICKDIPAGVRNGTYKNARIYPSSVMRTYSAPNLIQAFKIRFLNESDYKWQHCWKRVQTPNASDDLPSIETCYKSTLVIPMTLINSDPWLSHEFRSHFNIEGGLQRASFGFLCLDHQNKAFFNEKEDVDLGYIFADILSLYLIKRLTYTTYSAAFNEALTLISGNAAMP